MLERLAVEELFYQVALLLSRLLAADKVDTITWLTKDMVKYPLKKLNNDSKHLASSRGFEFYSAIGLFPSRTNRN